MPVLLTSMSRLPNASMVLATASAWCSASSHLPGTAMATSGPPSSATAASSASWPRAVTQTRAPCRTSSAAIPRPMPRLAPVTMATRSLSASMCFFLFLPVSASQGVQPLAGGGDPLVGRGQRDPDVAGALGPVHRARPDEDAALGGEQLAGRPAVKPLAGRPQVQPGLGVVDAESGGGQPGGQDLPASAVPGLLLRCVRVVGQ